MKKLYLLIWVLVITTNSNAQSQKNNEIQIGLNGSFFNYDKVFKWHRTQAIPLPTIAYWRNTKIGKFGLEAQSLFFRYEKESYEPGDIKKREYNQFQFNYSYDDFQLNFSSLETILVGSLCYRYGMESMYLGFSGMFDVYESNLYKDIGVSAGIQLKTKSFYRFYLGSDIKYFKYFSSYSSTLFQTIIFVGYEF